MKQQTNISKDYVHILAITKCLKNIYSIFIFRYFKFGTQFKIIKMCRFDFLTDSGKHGLEKNAYV